MRPITRCRSPCSPSAMLRASSEWRWPRLCACSACRRRFAGSDARRQRQFFNMQRARRIDATWRCVDVAGADRRPRKLEARGVQRPARFLGRLLCLGDCVREFSPIVPEYASERDARVACFRRSRSVCLSRGAAAHICARPEALAPRGVLLIVRVVFREHVR
eukprot:3755287-Rhodomonas_salina.3